MQTKRGCTVAAFDSTIRNKGEKLTGVPYWYAAKSTTKKLRVVLADTVSRVHSPTLVFLTLKIPPPHPDNTGRLARRPTVPPPQSNKRSK